MTVMASIRAARRRVAVLLVAAVAAGCADPGPTPRWERDPPRAPESPAEHAFLRCVAADPLFLTAACQAARAALSDDPTPGLFGR